MPYSFTVETRTRTQYVNVDHKVRQALEELELENGLLQLHVPHTTAGITINENADPDVLHDFMVLLDGVFPWYVPEFRHAEGNSAAHIKSSLVGHGVSLIVEDGRIQLGQWQSVFFCEYDGPRTRKVWALAVPQK